MNFAESHWMYALAAIPFLLIWFYFVSKIFLRRIALFRADAMALAVEKRRQILSSLLLTLVFASIVLALARPRFGFEWREVERSGADIMLVVDVSQSMFATDIDPNRLERARREIIDLLAMLQGDRIGLLLFAGVGFVQCPLTLDYSAVELFLDHITDSYIPVQGTAIGDAVRMAQKSLLSDSENTESEKAIILITDGEDHESEPLQAARAAAAKNIKIYGIGIGSAEGAPVPGKNGGFVRDAAGNLVISKLESGTLEQMAAISGGLYVRSTSGDLDLDKIYRQHIRADLSASGTVEDSREKVWNEYFWVLAALALLLLTVDFYREYMLKLRSAAKHD